MDRTRDRLSPAGPCDGRASRAAAASPAQLISSVLIPGKRLRIRRIAPPPPGEDAGRRVQLSNCDPPQRQDCDRPVRRCGHACHRGRIRPERGSGFDLFGLFVRRDGRSAPPPAPGTPGGAFPAVPAGGGGCYIGLNCGCIPRITCPTPHRRPPAVAPGHDAAGGPNP